MAHDTDICVLEAFADFRDIRLEHPFVISGRTID